MDFSKNLLLICTRSSSIYELDLKGDSEKPEPIMTSHCKGELWA